MKRYGLIPAIATIALLVPALALARAPQTYVAHLGSLNGSGATATEWLALDGHALTVTVQASGLEDGAHLRHIHGGPAATAGRSAVELSKCPTPAADANGDGIVSVAEGIPDYGAVILNLNTFASSGGTFSDTQTFQLTDAQLAALTPLDHRAVVIHGMTDPNSGAYDVTIPVACGQVHAIGH